jgi:predicted acyltransferase
MTTPEEPLPTQIKPATFQRLMSVDALRGFDMFWIIGADSLVSALNRMSQTTPTKALAEQLSHADWEGFHFYDLIFPLFVFIVGVSLVFSLTRTVEKDGLGTALARVFRRSILLFLIGIFYSGGFSSPWPDIRLMGVLNRIALAYFFAGLLFCLFKPRTLAGICVGLLAGYWALMTFVPIRDIQLTKSNLAALAEQAGDARVAALFREPSNPSAVKDSQAWVAAERMFYGTTNRVTGRFDRGLNLANHIDFQYLPGRKWDTFFDPEGYVSTIPSVATCLLGVLAGLLLKRQGLPRHRPSHAVFAGVTVTLLCLAVRFLWHPSSPFWMTLAQSVALGAVVTFLLHRQVGEEERKAWLLLFFGITALLLGWMWGREFPVIKKIWTSSYVLVAGGYSAILLGVFYLVVDVWKLRTWCQPFVWMGMNSITIYLAANVLGDFRKLAVRLVGGDVKDLFDAHVAAGFGDLIISIAGLLLAFWVVHFLYKRKIFLRL